MKILIIGLGSIAHKHIAALKNLARNSEIFALRSNESNSKVEGVSNCYYLEDVPSDIRFIIISNPTSLHFQTIQKVAHFGVPLFIEKPPIDSLIYISDLRRLIRNLNIPTYTAFNLRFHPVIRWLKDNIEYHRVIEVNAYCGSFLPDWRPGKDYRKGYSAQKELGGGVHLDLTHEIDYLLWIFGMPVAAKAAKRKLSDLEVDTVDSAKYWLEYETLTVNLTLNYFRRDSKRVVEIITDQTTLECDLLSNKIIDIIKDEVIFEASSFTISDTYLLQMEYFMDCLETKTPPMNSLLESIRTIEVCLK